MSLPFVQALGFTVLGTRSEDSFTFLPALETKPLQLLLRWIPHARVGVLFRGQLCAFPGILCLVFVPWVFSY